MSWLAGNWHVLLGMGGFGGIALRALTLWSQHQKILIEDRREKRRQTDSVALDLVEKLTGRVEVVEAREQVCQANLDTVHHELSNVRSMFRSTLRVLRFAPLDQHSQILREVEEELDDRARREAERGELRNRTQAEISAARVVRDAEAGKV